ncbi:MAG TPA: hypothetical protein VGC80_04170 [Acetobacteraceae bacterium]
MTRRYLSWWRAGAASLVTTPDGPGIASHAGIAVRAMINGDRTAQVTAQLYGPGEVLSLDTRQILRSDPPPGTMDFEPNYFPMVEVDSADLPWAFMPAAANAAGQLRPWLVLVAVRRDTARLDLGSGRPLPVLALDNAAAELPDLAQSWAWVHVQVAGAGDPAAILTGTDPTRTLSRFLCARRLAADTGYIAALVPAFAQGVQSGLGQPVDPGPLRPAWDTTTRPIELPVYYSWEFSTGPAGDFEELVNRLRFRRLDADAVSGLSVVLDTQPAGLPDAGTIRIPGALGRGGDTPPAVTSAEFTTQLRTLLDLQESAAVPPGLPLRLPTYGRWHAAAREVPASDSTGWLAQLDLHPAARAVAALGTRIVQERQEQLMAAAWEQAGPIIRANRLLRHGQFAREGSAALHERHFNRLADVDVVAVSQPAHARILAADGRTVEAHIAGHRVPSALLSVAARRVMRPRGPIGRRTPAGIGGLIERANARGRGPSGLPVGQVPAQPPGMVSTDLIGNESDLPRLCTTLPTWWADQPGPVSEPLRAAARPLREILLQHVRTLAPCTAPEPPPELGVAEVAKVVRDRLDPRQTIAIKIRDRISVPPAWNPRDPLEPILAAPDFPTPIYRLVAAAAPDLLLPQVDAMPANSVSSAGTNPWFIQALMVGLNHEMARELLWRGFPTDQRGTCFRRFWDRAGAVPPRTGAALDDIRPIPEWTAAEPLGVAGLRAATLDAPAEASQFVLLIRGDLLRRYPRAAILLVEADWRRDGGVPPVRMPRPDGVEAYPQFGGLLPPDISFVGFGITPEAARGADDPIGEAGYYVVFQQQPTEPRFGLDVSAPSVPTGGWGDLSWENVSLSASGHVVLGANDPIAIDPAVDTRGLHFTTAANSAQIAAVAEQRPVRVAVHARVLVPDGSAA